MLVTVLLLRMLDSCATKTRYEGRMSAISKEIFLFFILCFICSAELCSNKILMYGERKECGCAELLDDTIFIIFAELRRFRKSLEECKDDLEKMLYIIRNGWSLQNQPAELQNEIFTRLFAACDIPRFNEAKRIQYEKDMFDERRYNGEINAARREGREEASADIAKNMLRLAIKVETISRATGLSVEEVEALRD